MANIFKARPTAWPGYAGISKEWSGILSRRLNVGLKVSQKTWKQTKGQICFACIGHDIWLGEYVIFQNYKAEYRGEVEQWGLMQAGTGLSLGWHAIKNSRRNQKTLSPLEKAKRKQKIHKQFATMQKIGSIH